MSRCLLASSMSYIPLRRFEQLRHPCACPTVNASARALYEIAAMQQLPTSAGPHSDTRKIVEDFRSVVGSVRRGWRLVAVSVAISLTLAGLHLARSRTAYRASARLLVLQQGGQSLQMAGNSPLGNSNSFASSIANPNSLTTHVLLIRSPLIVERALASAKLRDVSIGSVVDGLKVELPEEAARIIAINYTADSREVASRVVDAVIESYNRFLKENFQKNTNENVALIVKARDELSRDLVKLEREYLAFRLKNPAYTADEKGRTFPARRLDQWDQATNQVLTRALQLRTQLELGRKLDGEGAGIADITNALNQLGGLGGDDQASPIVPANAVTTGPSHQRLGDELSEVEFQRKLAERLLSHLKEAATSRTVGDQELSRAFYAEPEAARLHGELENARHELESAQRLVRSSSDPSVTRHAARVARLQGDLTRYWQRRRPELLSQGVNGNSIDEAEGQLISLRAREAALRDHIRESRDTQLRQLHREREERTSRHGREHPSVRQVQEQITGLERATEEEDQDRPGEGQTRGLLTSIERSLESIEALQAKIQERFEAELDSTKKAEIDLLAESNLRNNLERHRSLFNSVVDQLKQAQLVSDYGSVSAQTIDPTSAHPIRPRMASILILALLAGCGLGGAAAFAADLLDARVRTVVELRSILDLPVLGMIEQLPRDQIAAMGELGLLSHSTPNSQPAESYKSARTNLESLRRNRRAQVLLVTSALSGDGKSTTASNLAISLAHTGRRVLLIDADLRKPSQHAIHNLRRDHGLVHLLKGVLPVDRLVQPSPINNLDLLTAGPDVPNPAELLASRRLAEVLEEARPTYDVVIIDSSPLLAVTDPSVIAAAVDGILLVVRLEESRRHDIERASELLESLGVPVLGIVINGVTREQVGFRHRYGYGYPYGRPSKSSGPLSALKGGT